MHLHYLSSGKSYISESLFRQSNINTLIAVLEKYSITKNTCAINSSVESSHQEIKQTETDDTAAPFKKEKGIKFDKTMQNPPKNLQVQVFHSCSIFLNI